MYKDESKCFIFGGGFTRCMYIITPEGAVIFDDCRKQCVSGYTVKNIIENKYNTFTEIYQGEDK